MTLVPFDEQDDPTVAERGFRTPAALMAEERELRLEQADRERFDYAPAVWWMAMCPTCSPLYRPGRSKCPVCGNWRRP